MASNVLIRENFGDHRKKRKSGQRSKFLTKAKKFGKQGKLGHGFQVDKDTYDYFLRVHEICQKDEFDNDEERDAFIDNAFEQTVGQEVNLSSNQMVCRVLERMLPLANDKILERFNTEFKKNLRTISTDVYASHILEKLLEVTSSKWQGHQGLTEWFRETCKFILNNFEEFVFDNYSNRVMRKAFQCLSGTVEIFAKTLTNPISKSTKLPNAQQGENDQPSKVDPVNIQIFKDFVQQFLNWPQFFDLFEKEYTSGLVQSLIQILKYVDENLLFQLIVQSVKAIKTVNLDKDSAHYLHVLELCLSVGSEAAYHQVFNKYFKDSLTELMVHPQGNYTFRKLVTFAPDKETFEMLFDTAEKHFKEIYEKDKTNIFVALAEGCKRYSTRQSEFMKGITPLVVTSDGVNFVDTLARFNKKFQPKEDGKGSTFNTDINGTLVLQHLLDFHKPTKVVSSLFDMETSKLAQFIQDPKASHVMDSFFKSTTVGEKNKEKMLKKLQEDLVTLACNKFGSRVIDSMWNWSSMAQKATITSVLSKMEAKVSADQYGKYIAEKSAVRLYKLNTKQWEEFLKSAGKKKDELEKFKQQFVSTEEEKVKEHQNGHVSKKKKKKSKAEAGEDEEEHQEISEEPVKIKTEIEDDDEEATEKKKKKKKSKTQVEDEVLEEPKEKKKKKKKSKSQGEDNEGEAMEGEETISKESEKKIKIEINDSDENTVEITVKHRKKKSKIVQDEDEEQPAKKKKKKSKHAE